MKTTGRAALRALALKAELKRLRSAAKIEVHLPL